MHTRENTVHTSENAVYTRTARSMSRKKERKTDIKSEQRKAREKEITKESNNGNEGTVLESNLTG